MKIYNFGPKRGEKIEKFDSDFIFSRITHSNTGVKVSCFHLTANGVVGYHQATTQQLFLVLRGKGWVRGGFPNRIPIAENQAVFWDKNEWHEAGTDTGLVAIVIEGDFMNPSDFMSMDWDGFPNQPY
ncbi:MAG: cupin [Chloroflexi bacterium]|nr:cupin [Chloroflexota bacterium]